MSIIDKVADLVIEVETKGIVRKTRIGDVPLPGQVLEATFGEGGRSHRCDEDDWNELMFLYTNGGFLLFIVF